MSDDKREWVALSFEDDYMLAQASLETNNPGSRALEHVEYTPTTNEGRAAVKYLESTWGFGLPLQHGFEEMLTFFFNATRPKK